MARPLPKTLDQWHKEILLALKDVLDLVDEQTAADIMGYCEEQLEG